MDSFELNKLLGALLGTIFIVFSVSLIADNIFYSPVPKTPGFVIDVPEDAGHGQPVAEAGPSVLDLIADADAAAGEQTFRLCARCHTADPGGQNLAGPNLWNIVNRPVAAKEGFSYSGAMRSFADGGTVWDWEHLSGFLVNPRGYVPGTTMAFAGIRDVQEEANLLAYLRTLSDSPADAPEPAAAAADEDAPAEDADAAPAEEPAADSPAAPVQPTPEEDGTAVSPETDAGTPAGQEEVLDSELDAGPTEGQVPPDSRTDTTQDEPQAEQQQQEQPAQPADETAEEPEEERLPQ